MNAIKLIGLGLLLFSLSQGQAQNPYKDFGKDIQPLTLSGGKYDESFDEDSIVQIGTVLFNTNTGKIVAFIEQDTLRSEATLEPQIVSKWLSPDPLAGKFPFSSPYVFADNNPIYLIDPDGKAVIPSAAFLRSTYAPVFQKLQANTVYKHLVEKFEAPETKSTFNYRVNYQDKPSDYYTQANAKTRLGQTTWTSDDQKRDGRDNLVGIDIGTAMFAFPMTKKDDAGNTLKLNELGQVTAFLHEVVHASFGANDMDASHKSMTENGGRADIQAGLLEYSKANNIPLTDEQAELISWTGLQATPAYAARFGFEGKSTEERTAIVKENNKKIDAIIFNKENKTETK